VSLGVRGGKRLNTTDLIPTFYTQGAVRSYLYIKLNEYFQPVEVLLVVTPCGVIGYRRFGEPCCLHFKDKVPDGGSMDP
jgi:hypothetical protein